MIGGALNFLSLLGYLPEESDEEIINSLYEKVLSDVKSFCNLEVIPTALENVVLFRTIGEFISAKKNCGQTGGFSKLNFEPVMSQISEGDTSITYNMRSIRSDERRLNLLVTALIGFGKNQLVKYRRIIW